VRVTQHADHADLLRNRWLTRWRPPPVTSSALTGATCCAAMLRKVEDARRMRGLRMKLKLDLHDIYNRGQDIDRALREIIDEAVSKKAPLVEIIPGKGSGQLKKHVLRFLEQKEIKSLYHRVEKDSKNFGRLFVHFRWK
jgi:DNA-nicking Smr family endonuclease